MNTWIKNASVVLPDGTVKVTDIAITGDTITSIGQVPEGWQVLSRSPIGLRALMGETCIRWQRSSRARLCVVRLVLSRLWSCAGRALCRTSYTDIPAGACRCS